MAADTEQRTIEIILKAQDANASLKEMAAGAAVMTAQLSRMGQDDPGRAALLNDLQLLNGRLADGRAAMRARAQSAEELAAADAAAAAAAEELARAEAAAAEAVVEANRQTIATGQQATASLNEMKAAAALMEKQLLAMNADDPGRAALQRDFTQLNQRIGEANTAMRTHIKTEAELAAEQAELAAATEELNRKNMQVVVDGQKVNATFGEMKASAALLEKQLESMSRDDPGRAKLLADYKALQQRIGEVREEMGHATEKGSLFKEALAFAGITVGAEAILEGVKELGAEIVNTTKEVAELRANINTLTGASGKDLDELTTSVLSVSRTFGKDFNEVLAAGNTLSKQMGVSQQEAMRLIEQGFLAGADAGGDFLDQVKEYAPQFKAAGASADEFIGHLANASNQGIFSDKGADVVKEFGLRIREQTKATSDAMQAAFGSDFTKSIFAGINDGSLTVEQALQRVAKEMDETKIPANQLQTVIADVFGGPGEDAGVEYLKSLKNVGKGVDEMVDKTNAYTQRQAALLASNKELAEAQNALTKEFEGGGTTLDTLTNQGLTVLYTLLASLGATFKELFQPVQQVWQSLTDLAESMGWVSKQGLSAKSAGEMLGNVIRFLFTPTKLLWGVIADVVKATVEWVKGSETAQAVLNVLTFNVRAFFELLRNGPAYVAGFTAAFGAAFDSIGRAWELLKSGDLAGARAAFAARGENAARAFRAAFDAAMAEKASSSAKSESAGDAGPPRAQGGDGVTDADRKKAAEKTAKDAKAARDKADQERLNDLKKWVQQDGQILDSRDLAAAARQEAANTDELKRRELQRQKIVDEADKKYNALLVQEGDHTQAMAAVIEERDLQLRELQAKFDEQDEQKRLEDLDKKLADSMADDELELAALELKHEQGKLTEQEYQDQLYEITKRGLEKRLALLVSAGQGESVEAKNIKKALLKTETDHISKSNDKKQDAINQDTARANFSKLLNAAEVDDLVATLGKKSLAYLSFQAVKKAMALWELKVNLEKELSENRAQSAAFPPPFNVAYLVATDTLSVARAAMGARSIMAFAKGGKTTQGKDEMSVMEVISILGGKSGGSQAPGGSFASGGPVDGPTIGLIGEAGAELVIPNWLYADPKQANLMGFLEAQIASRGNAFATGGSTTGSSAVVATDPTSDTSGQLVELVQQLVRSHQEFRDEITDWQRNLDVNLDPRKAKKALDVVTKVQSGGGLR